MKTKSLEEIVDNYIIGAIQGAYKQKRHWINKGFSESKAIENAINWAIRMLDESSDPGYHATIFRELEAIANALATVLEKRANS